MEGVRLVNDTAVNLLGCAEERTTEMSHSAQKFCQKIRFRLRVHVCISGEDWVLWSLHFCPP